MMVGALPILPSQPICLTEESLAHKGRWPRVLNDEPTLRDLRDESTLLDPRLDPRRRKPGAPPTWPVPEERNRQPSGRGRPHLGCWGATALVASVVLASAVLLVSLLGVTGHAGLLSLSRLAARSSPGVATPGPAVSPTPVSGWLQLSPTSVQFGCADGQRTQVVVLENRGPSHVRWQVSFSSPTDQAGVDISPHEGDLAAGASTAIQLQDTSHSGGQRNVIQFTATDPGAGPPPNLSFTPVGCN
jgi:hypothetical protein